MLMRSRVPAWRRRVPPGFIPPCQPVLADRVPSGDGWLHELKHDGFRDQARSPRWPRFRSAQSANAVAGGPTSEVRKTLRLGLKIIDALDPRDNRGTGDPFGNVPPRYNGAPSQQLWVIRQNPQTGERSLDLLQWGLIPYWCKDKPKPPPINAKGGDGRSAADVP